MKITFNLSDSLRKWLTENEVTQRDFSMMADLNQNTVSRYLSGDMQQPKLETVARICEIIGVTDIKQVFDIDFEEDAS